MRAPATTTGGITDEVAVRTGGAWPRSRASSRCCAGRVRLEQLEHLERAAQPARRRSARAVQKPADRVADRRQKGRHADGARPRATSNTSTRGIAYYSVDYTVVFATQRPLYSNKPNTETEPTPDMAAGPPEISADGKTVTVHIREGVHFSPPVNREVTSEDVAYAIERGANPNVANPYFQSYFGSIEGAETATGGPIKGIETPNKHDDRLPPHRTEGAAPRRRAGAAADRRRCRRNTPKNSTSTSRRTTPPTRSRRARTCSRTTAKAKSSAIGYSPASRRRSCATRTGTRAPTTAPRT